MAGPATARLGRQAAFHPAAADRSHCHTVSVHLPLLRRSLHAGGWLLACDGTTKDGLRRRASSRCPRASHPPARVQVLKAVGLVVVRAEGTRTAVCGRWDEASRRCAVGSMHSGMRRSPPARRRPRAQPEKRDRHGRYGARRDEMRAIFDTTGDWARLLQAFAQAAPSGGAR